MPRRTRHHGAVGVVAEDEGVGQEVVDAAAEVFQGEVHPGRLVPLEADVPTPSRSLTGPGRIGQGRPDRAQSTVSRLSRSRVHYATRAGRVGF